jgi:transcriptional regulator with XRE-family HTH domain
MFDGLPRQDLIRVCRIAQHKTQQECASDCGLTKVAWGHYERGEAAPRSKETREYIERLTGGRVPASSWEN